MTTMKLKMIPCPKCGNDFPEKRKELGYHVCINCSTTSKVVGITTVEGSGDHTWNDIIIMDQHKANAIAKAEAAAKGKTLHLDTVEDEAAVSQSLKDAMISMSEYSADTIFDPNKKTPKTEDVNNLVQGIDY